MYVCVCVCICVPAIITVSTVCFWFYLYPKRAINTPPPCSSDALEKNQELEFQRNKERFQFLKWGAKAFQNMLIVPPGSGIVHQVRSSGGDVIMM